MTENEHSYERDDDSAWKDLLDLYFEEFLEFFFPQVHAAIDWTIDVEFPTVKLLDYRDDQELDPNSLQKRARA